MTELCVKIYRFFKAHRLIYVAVLVALFALCGWFATRVHFEEDINKLLPSSKNPDGTTKLAFADLRIKDKTYVLFEGTDTDSLISVCDAFMDSLLALNEEHKMLDNVFYRIDSEELLPEVIGYLSEHLPSYIDTTLYTKIDSLLTPAHFAQAMQQNHDDLMGEFGSMYPELIQMDPMGMRTLLKDQFSTLMGGTGTGSYRTVDDHIFVRDSSVCVAFLTPAFSSTNTGQGSALFDIITHMIPKFQGSGVNISFHGTPANGFYNASTIKRDLKWTVGGSLIIVLLLILLTFRRWQPVVLMVVPVLFGALFGLAMMYFIKGELSLLALGIGSVVLGVALSYALHVITHHAYINNVEQVLRDETKPVMLGCITTIGSFVGIIFIHTDLLRDFGLFAAFAIVGTTLFSLLLLPVMLSGKGKQPAAWLQRACSYTPDTSKIALIVITLITVVCVGAFCVGGVNFDADMHNLGYNDKQVKHSEQLLQSKTFTGDKEKFFAASGKTMKEAIANFQTLKQKLDSLQQAGLVKSYTHTGDIFVPLDVQQQRIDAWHNFWTPQRLATVRRLIAQTAPAAGLNADAFDDFFETATADYEPDAIYKADIIPAGYLCNLMEETYGGDCLCFTSVRFKNNGDTFNDSTDYYRICDAVSSSPNMMVLDTYYYARDTLRQLNSDFNVLQWISLLFVFIVLLLSFHFNLKHSVLGFMPIVLSWLIVLGAMVIFGMKFNLISIIISTFIFGIGVDYSIFVMNALTSGDDDKLRYHKAAILLSAAILIITVGSMLLAKHPAIKSVGFSTLVGLVSAVVLSYVVQPAIFRLLNRKKSPNP